MSKLYDKIFLENTIELTGFEIGDIENWSVHNDDEYNEEIFKLREAYKKLRKKVEI